MIRNERMRFLKFIINVRRIVKIINIFFIANIYPGKNLEHALPLVFVVVYPPLD